MVSARSCSRTRSKPRSTRSSRRSTRARDAVITGKSAIGGNQNNKRRRPVPPAVAARPGSQPTGRARGGRRCGRHRAPGLARRQGDQSTERAPNLAFSVNPHGNQRFNPLALTAGRWPAAPDEIAIDSKTASNGHFNVGDTIRALARGPAQPYRIVGLVRSRSLVTHQSSIRQASLRRSAPLWSQGGIHIPSLQLENSDEVIKSPFFACFPDNAPTNF